MGGIISRLRQSNDSDYERILSDLDSNIRKAELRLSAINIREKRLLGLWLVYSVLAWLAYTAVFALYLHSQYQHYAQQWILSLVPVIIGPPAISVGRSLITVWYRRKKANEESQLAMLRADQRLKVEELKKKTAYYSTKTLLERYDQSSQRPNNPRVTGPDGRPVPASQNGHPRPQQPNMMDPGLRQRQGPGVTNAQGVPVGPGRHMGVSSGMEPHQQQQLHHGQGPQNAPRGPQGPYNPQQPQFNPGNLHPSSAGRSPYGSPERHWYDKIVDVIVGDEGPDTRYALICGQCYAHNGLALPQEIEDIQYICPKCSFFNPSRRKTRLNGVPSPSSPEMTLLQAQARPLPASREPSPSPSARRPAPDNHRHGQQYPQDGPGLAEGSSPELASDLPRVNNGSEGEDIEFVDNWNDSDAEGVNHDEGDDEDEDGVPGYDVGADDGSKAPASETVSTRTRAASKKSNRA